MWEFVICTGIAQDLCLVKYTIDISVQVDRFNNEVNDISTVAIDLTYFVWRF